MKYVACLLVGLAFAAAVTAARAEFKTATQLAELCDPRVSGEQGLAWCLGYIAGVTDTLDATRANNGAQQCVPPNVNLAQVAKIFGQFVLNNRDHAEELASMPAATVVILSIANTWCPTGADPFKRLR
jgi:hypothetical protein